jgi:hypothetical protein
MELMDMLTKEIRLNNKSKETHTLTEDEKYFLNSIYK